MGILGVRSFVVGHSLTLLCPKPILGEINKSAVVVLLALIFRFSGSRPTLLPFVEIAAKVALGVTMESFTNLTSKNIRKVPKEATAPLARKTLPINKGLIVYRERAD